MDFFSLASARCLKRLTNRSNQPLADLKNGRGFPWEPVKVPRHNAKLLGSAVRYEFQGGEPLLNFDLIKYIVLEAKRRNVAEKRDLAFVIATNLSFLTDEILNFCRDHAILISTSAATIIASVPEALAEL
jgi:hypothetical protein